MRRIIAVREVALTCVGISITAIAAVFAGADYYHIATASAAGYFHVSEVIGFTLVVVALLYGNLVYQLARYGYWRRSAGRSLFRTSTTGAAPSSAAPSSVVILIPSYREEIHVLRQTIVSAALAEHSDRRVVVLLDDPPVGTPRQLAALEATRLAIRD